MNAFRFQTVSSFERLVAKGDSARIRATCIEIICRWDFLLNGYIGLPFDFGETDLIERVHVILKAAGRMPIPEFPLASSDYTMTFQSWWDMLPASFQVTLLSQNEEQPVLPETAEWGNRIVWGQAALGGVPGIYAGLESGLRMPGTFWDAASRSGGGKGYDFNEFEKWLLAQEGLVYHGTKIHEAPDVFSAGDVLADRRIRAIYCEYRLSRSNGFGKDEIEWEATHLPIPVLAWWLRFWIRQVDSGHEIAVYGDRKMRNNLLSDGCKAIKNWVKYPIPELGPTTEYVSIEVEGQPVVFMVDGGMLGAPEKTVEMLGDELSAGFEAAAEELRQFGFDVKPVTF